MTTGVVIIIAFGLAMDAFAVAICKGLAMKRVSWKEALICGLWFGGFQALMPTIGYFLGYHFQRYIEAFDHWIAFALLAALGVNMFVESFSDEECEGDGRVGAKEMLVPAIATSIDALAVGITFAFLKNSRLVFSVSAIGVITCVLSMIGTKLGNLFGCKCRTIAQRLGAIILFFIGLKILLEHLGIIQPLF